MSSNNHFGIPVGFLLLLSQTAQKSSALTSSANIQEFYRFCSLGLTVNFSWNNQNLTAKRSFYIIHATIFQVITPNCSHITMSKETYCRIFPWGEKKPMLTRGRIKLSSRTTRNSLRNMYLTFYELLKLWRLSLASSCFRIVLITLVRKGFLLRFIAVQDFDG